MNLKTKICGLKTREAVLAADKNGADFLGFIFYEKSPRNITPALAAEISTGVKAKKVAVVVDADDAQLAEIVAKLKPDFIQLHGQESEARASEIKIKFGLPLIRSKDPSSPECDSILGRSHEIPLESLRDSGNDRLYEFLLFDSPGGGTGKQFDYEGFTPPNGEWFLSGGLNAANVADAVKKTGARMIDVSSGVEREKGVKDIALIEQFLRIIQLL